MEGCDASGVRSSSSLGAASPYGGRSFPNSFFLGDSSFPLRCFFLRLGTYGVALIAPLPVMDALSPPLFYQRLLSIGGHPVGGHPVGGHPVGGHPLGDHPIGGRPIINLRWPFFSSGASVGPFFRTITPSPISCRRLVGAGVKFGICRNLSCRRIIPFGCGVSSPSAT